MDTSYSSEEYRALNKKQRMKLKQHCKKNKGSAKKRGTSAVVTSDANEDNDDEETTPPKKKTKNVCTIKLVSMKETPPPAEDLSAGYERRPKHIIRFANSKCNKPFEEWEDPVWTHHQPTKKIWMSWVEATFYRITGINKPEYLPMLDGKLLLIKEHQTIKKAKQAYIDQLERLNDKENTRAKPYDHQSKHWAWSRKLASIPALLEDGGKEGAKAAQQEVDAIKAAYELHRKEELKKAPIMADQFGHASAIANSI